MSNGTLNPAFSATNLTYNATAAITVNSQVVKRGQASQAIKINIGDNTIAVVVSTTIDNRKTYIIVVRRVTCSTCLAGLIVKVGRNILTLNPTLVKTQLNYIKTTSSTTTSVKLSHT